MIFTNGRIHTMDATATVVGTIVVRDGRIAFTGRRGDVNAGAREPELDLHGRALLPGFVDAHAHLTNLAKTRLEIRVAHLASEPDAAAVVATTAATMASGEWITGRGWDQTRWPGGAFPTRAVLDHAAPDHPVALVRVDGHAIWANSAALRRAGVDRHTGIPSMQATHCTSDMRWAAERLGADRLRGAYAWRSLLATGTIIAGGSDFPVEDPNPFHGLHAAVTRRPREGDHPAWWPEQRMTRLEAMRSFTSWNAWAAGQEAELGSLEPGQRADLVVLDDDVLTCDETRIKDVAPLLTMVGGEIAYERQQPAEHFEERHGFAGARRAPGGLGGRS